MMKHDNNDHHRNSNKVLSSATKLVSRETSAANSSCRVYYGAAAGAVPFMWESQPGTPKHTLSETSLPPLTPPPSYSVNANPTSSSTIRRSGARAKAVLDYIIPKALKSRTKGSRNMSPTSSSVSWSSSSSSSTSCSSTSSKGTQKRYNSVPFGYDDEDEDEDLRRRSGSSPTSTLCFGIKRRGSDYLRSYGSVRKIKFAFMSINSSHDQSRRG